MPQMKRSPTGFSLTELLVTLFIASLLAAIALPALLSQIRKAKEVEVLVQLDAIALEVREHQLEKGFYPPDVDPGIKPEGINSFPLTPGTVGNARFDYDLFCIDGTLFVKALWYGWDDERQDNYARPYNAEIGDDLVKVIAVAKCEG